MPSLLYWIQKARLSSECEIFRMNRSSLIIFSRACNTPGPLGTTIIARQFLDDPDTYSGNVGYQYVEYTAVVLTDYFDSRHSQRQVPRQRWKQ